MDPIVYTLMNCFHLLLSLPISFSVFLGEGSSYVEDLEKRLERLESEKLELVKVSHRIRVTLHACISSISSHSLQLTFWPLQMKLKIKTYQYVAYT